MHTSSPALPHAVLFPRLLGGDPASTALWTEHGPITFQELGQRVNERARTLGSTRRLVLLACRNTAESIVTYLAAVTGAHPVLLAQGGESESARRSRAALIERFDPDVIAADEHLEMRREGTRHVLHDELALLASTSGSTGSPKLVRLSRENLLSNAAAIAGYLDLSSNDRAITTLPMYYCYGLSVINSHLLAGGSVALTERSLTEDGFWELAERTRITGLAGVPYSFELLASMGGPNRLPETVRYVTQAGGRLSPDKVRELAGAGRERGFDFFVMYGQTEATARMSYVPAEDAERAAGSIGRPISGGAFEIDTAVGGGSDADVGELVYSGPNVMLGYAEDPRDLALGRTIDVLRTGDLARRRSDGYIEIVGRISRFVKLFGLRVDLDAVQRHLVDCGIEARTASDDEQLLVFVRRITDVNAARDAVARQIGVPAHGVAVHRVDEFPLTPAGKPDHAALRDLHRTMNTPEPAITVTRAAGDTAGLVRDVLAVCTGRPEATLEDSFSGLGGDSLGYVEAAVRLEDLLDNLPRDWPSLTATQLAELGKHAPPAAPATPKRRWLRDVETPVLLRALAIILIVGTHARLFPLQGGAHLLLIVAGYNLARFALSPAPGSRSRRLLVAAAQVAVPAVLWIAAVTIVDGRYTLTTVLLLNNTVPVGPQWNDQWQYWFLEAMVWSMLALAAVFAIPAVDRWERRAPWGFATVVLAVSASIRYVLVGPGTHDMMRFAAPTVLWFIALGWLIARATGPRHRLLATLATLVMVPGFFGQPLRETIIVTGACALIWIPAIRIPAALRPAVVLLASASLFVYLTHWVVFPAFERSSPLLGTVLSFFIGILTAVGYRQAIAGLARVLAICRRQCDGLPPRFLSRFWRASALPEQPERQGDDGS